ncbi:MAG: hypothetical protein R3B47_11365 [Bacteroidia bacterium]
MGTIWAFDDSEYDDSRIIIGNQDCGTNVTTSTGWKIILGGDGYQGRIDDESGLMVTQSNSTVRLYDYVANSLKTTENSTFPPDPTVGGTSWYRISSQMYNHPQTGDMYWAFNQIYRRKKPKKSVATPMLDLWELEV